MMAQYRVSLSCLLLASCLLWLSVSQRLGATYLEDDLLWFVPSVEHILRTQSLSEILKSFHASEMTLIDGTYFSLLLTFVGHSFPVYAFLSFVWHFLTALAFFFMLVVGLRFSQKEGLLASLIFLTFFGHYHVYIWPMAAHHTWVVLLSCIMMTLYLVADRRLDENKSIGQIYGWMVALALCAGFQRLSILVLPAMIIAHAAWTHPPLRFLERLRKWLVILYLLSAYQVTTILAGGKQDVLNKILYHNEGQWSWYVALGAAAGWGAVILVLYFLLQWRIRKSAVHKGFCLRWPWYGLVFFSYPLSLCCYAFFSPAALIGDQGVYQRWQPLALPVAMWEHLGWVFLGAGLLFYLIRTALVKRDLLIFLVWYLFFTPYLAHQGENIPSRYLLYVSPVLAVSVVLIWQQLKIKWIRMAVTLGLVILMAGNIWAIHVRSLASWITDYRWSYDFIKYAHFIKEDLAQKGISPSEAAVCVKNVAPIPFLNIWKGAIVPDDFDGYAPLMDISESVFGGPLSSFRVNQDCLDKDEVYDARVMDVAGVRLWDSPIRGRSLELLSQDYHPDAKILHNDRLIYRDFFSAGFPNFSQGRFLETYHGFSIFYFDEYFFAVDGQDFNLFKFKTNSYPASYAASTLGEVRQWIDVRQGFQGAVKASSQVPASLPLRQSYVFRLGLWGIPAGRLEWHMGQGMVNHEEYTYSVFTLRPWPSFAKRYGYVFKTMLDQGLRPLQSQEGSLTKFKKGSVGTVVYDHDQGVMNRRGKTEDILSDTKDLAGLLTWFLKQDYQGADIFQTSFHQGRDLYHCEISPVRLVGREGALNIHISRVRRDFSKESLFALEAVVRRQGDMNVPEKLIYKVGFLRIPLYCAVAKYDQQH